MPVTLETFVNICPHQATKLILKLETELVDTKTCVEELRKQNTDVKESYEEDIEKLQTELADTKEVIGALVADLKKMIADGVYSADVKNTMDYVLRYLEGPERGE